MAKRTKIMIGSGAAALVVLVIVVVCILFFATASKEDGKAIEKISENIETSTGDPNEGKTLSLLTGEYVNDTRAARRPIAVMYNNIIDAIPQSGIGEAEIIYEAPVEGGITRLMCIFDNYPKIEKMGSVRSSRLYYCYFALEWDAIYCHYGQSKYALSFLESDSIDNLGSYNAGNYYYRSSDRAAPHNCYTSGSQISDAISDLGYRKNYKKGYDGHFAFADYGEKVSLDKAKEAKKVSIGYSVNQPWFEYNEDDGLYYRYQYGGKHIDDQTGETLLCSNIIIQFVNSTYYPDNKSLDITLTGSGKGWFVTNGLAKEITWEKSDSTGQTRYFDENKEDITLNTGKTWFCIVLQENADNVVFGE